MRRTELTRQNRDQESDQCRVANVQDRASQAPKADAACPKSECIQENISPGHSCAEECPPLPSVIFSTEQEIHEQNGCTGRGDDRKTVTDEQEAEHIIDFVGP